MVLGTWSTVHRVEVQLSRTRSRDVLPDLGG